MTPHRHLPRLIPQHYRGHAFVHWIFTLRDRRPVTLTDTFHQRFREILLHTLARHELACPAYAWMPDHLHMFWVGLSERADMLLAAHFLARYGNPLLVPGRFQKQPYDHVIRHEDRDRDALPRVVAYILGNARGTPEEDWRAYPFVGAMIPGYPDLDPRVSGCWERFWSIYARLIARDDPGPIAAPLP